ncbi:hypothetical protein ACVW1C_008353 [Bradyrhizobium sp. USDA 4011]|nr:MULTISPECIES: hypothetical protein [Hyphomicrobiales]CAH1663454.1 conserved hypothetical protein [Hyphomicrobiales bacterium]MCO5079719.1 hypothetical protein [Chelatococcus sp.]CAH1686877.1 conserved hypothetical protein [Hyphomicrobiales bacterium]CAH1696618.1 conserved hypothetical protein [Hyphomicrobiales bacterium]CAH1696639.1 conserved hypothetical protein [Hyphomicrobiales bacterium]
MPAPITLPARPSLPSVIYSDDEPVLAGVAIRDDADRAQLHRFGDDHWDLSAAIFRVNARYSNYRLNFARIADPVTRRLAKEYVIARLRIHLPGYRAPCGATSAIRLLRYIQHFAAFLRTQLGAVDLGRVDPALLDAYLVHARDGGRRTPHETVKYVEVPIDLHHLAPWLTGGGIGFLPWRGRAAHRVAGRPPAPAENATPRIPEPVIGAMLRWALKYVEIYAPDILAARAELDALEARCARLMARDQQTGRAVARTYRARVAKWLDARRAAGRGIPIWERAPNAARRIDPLTGQELPPYNLHLMRLHAGAPESGRVSQSEATARLIEEMAAELGTEVGGLDTPISIDPDTGLSWRERFDGLSLAREERMLQGACYIVCAYLTGMRDSEVQAMQPGCVSPVRSGDGLVERYRVRSTVYKRHGPRGVTADWITIEPVARAVEVMEVLSARNRKEKGLSSLWVTLKDWPWSADHLGMGATATLNLFRDGLDARSEGGPAIPRPGDEPWKFTTRQLRRTISWYIANRPFGTIAGKIQYKHASVAMFEGYAGSARADFRLAVERERALGQLDDIVAHYEAYLRDEGPAGPGAARLRREFARVHDEIGDLPGRIMDRKRLRTTLAHLGRTLHVGFLNDCLFDAATALCLTDVADPERTAPALSRCSPDRCPNACLTARHREPWQASIAEGEGLLADRRLSPLQREAIARDNERKRRLIAPLIEGAA